MDVVITQYQVLWSWFVQLLFHLLAVDRTNDSAREQMIHFATI